MTEPQRAPWGARAVALLGSTGSIGVSTLEVVASFPQRLRVVALAAGRNLPLLRQQVQQFRPDLISVEREEDAARLGEELAGDRRPPRVLWGEAGAAAVATHPAAAVVVSAMVGAAGLRPTLAALGRGVRVAIANKEPLVMAGQLCRRAALESRASLFPIDSEHSAIYQALLGHRREEVSRLILTGSGGPFRDRAELAGATVEEALRHPTWRMGRKVTIDSATLMNKGLEVIEAHWLFQVDPSRIEVLIHPESVVHSMVEYRDGSVLAQLASPDMRLPIAYALGFPERLELSLPRLQLARLGQLSFREPDLERFPCLALAYRALQLGGTAPAVLSAANEVAVQAFLEGALAFTEIGQLIEQVLRAHQVLPGLELEELFAADAWARGEARALLPRSLAV